MSAPKPGHRCALDGDVYLSAHDPVVPIVTVNGERAVNVQRLKCAKCGRHLGWVAVAPGVEV